MRKIKTKIKVLTVEKILDSYLNRYLKYEKPKSLACAQTCANNLMPFFEKIDYRDIKPYDVIDYLNSRRDKGAKPNTLKNEISVLQAAINRAIKQGLIEKFDDVSGDYHVDYKKAKNLTSILRDQKPKQQIRKLVPSQSDVEALLNYLPEPLMYFFYAKSHLGYRSSELLNLDWCDVHFDDNEILIDKTKNGYGRMTPLFPEIKKFLYDLYVKDLNKYGLDKISSIPVFKEKDGSRIKQGNIYRRWKTACKGACLLTKNGKHKYNPHDLRKAAIRYLLEIKNFDRYMVVDVYTGHRTFSVFENVYNMRNGESYNVYKRIAIQS